MLGQLKVPFTPTTHFLITGGPSHEAKQYPEMTFVKMAKELRLDCDIDIPTVDFSTPAPADLAKGLEKAVDAVLNGTPLYVGCMAGRGRTGLFLAVLARAFGVDQPVEFVRANYFAHAVETTDQYNYVMNFPIPTPVQEKIKRARFWQKVKFWKKGNLTN